MDRRISVIIAIICCEALLRLGYQALPSFVDPLTYTLAARLAEMMIILSLAFNLCGVRAKSIKKEFVIGIGVSVAFGAAVIIIDLLSRLVLADGILRMLLQRQHIKDPLLFFLTGCIIGPFVEELFFRGLFYSWLRERLPITLSVVFSAIAFASMHGFIMPIQVVGGLLFAGLFEWRKSIWAPYIVHIAANFGIWVFPWIYPLW